MIGASRPFCEIFRESPRERNEAKWQGICLYPNSSADLLNLMELLKRRYYDEYRRAKEDIDFNHSDDGTHTFPHRYKWDRSKKPPRQKPE